MYLVWHSKVSEHNLLGISQYAHETPLRMSLAAVRPTFLYQSLSVGRSPTLCREQGVVGVEAWQLKRSVHLKIWGNVVLT